MILAREIYSLFGVTEHFWHANIDGHTNCAIFLCIRIIKDATILQGHMASLWLVSFDCSMNTGLQQHLDDIAVSVTPKETLFPLIKEYGSKNSD